MRKAPPILPWRRRAMLADILKSRAQSTGMTASEAQARWGHGILCTCDRCNSSSVLDTSEIEDSLDAFSAMVRGQAR